MEHIEEAGIHSGDSACALPPHSLDAKTIAELERQTRALALALNVGGLMNVQYAIKDGDIYVLEVNPRASRTVPFVAKVIGLPVAKIALAHHGGREPRRASSWRRRATSTRAVKEAVFPFARFPGVDTVLGPEMKSTGEVMGIDRELRHRLRQEPDRRRHQPAAALAPCSSRCKDDDKPRILAAVKLLAALGFKMHRHFGHPALPGGATAWRRPRSTRCWKAGRIDRRRHQKRRCSAGFQHHRGGDRAGRQPLAAPRRPLA